MKFFLLQLLFALFLFSSTVYSQDLVEVFPGLEGKGFGMLTWGDFNGDGNMDLITGIGEFTANSFSIYPNPANDRITLSVFKRTFDKAEIVDVLGNVVWKRDKWASNRINIQNLKSGVYFLRMEADGKVVSKKFLKQ